MKTIKALMILLILSLVGGQAFSQKKEVTSEQRAERQTKWMTKELNLTSEQAAKVAEVNLKYLKLIDEAQNTIANESDRRAKVSEYQKQRMAALKEILTPEQFEKLKQLLKERRNNQTEN